MLWRRLASFYVAFRYLDKKTGLWVDTSEEEVVKVCHVESSSDSGFMCMTL